MLINLYTFGNLMPAQTLAMLRSLKLLGDDFIVWELPLPVSIRSRGLGRGAAFLCEKAVELCMGGHDEFGASRNYIIPFLIHNIEQAPVLVRNATGGALFIPEED
uniref:Uncharacterized protein n=1 Tax=Chromera velia CCMP2878 TaxID=1169474 RepID=A0A0G4GMJ5_9ALVE|eukprot:Cvel_22537.t1-p1 / transcript=Cvel_22537.t1 / gene=Cvel_22537 / organism=Chromera_velia_CCMP2878 / gene_product=hypothetical protein / transcript_product=hypothetical protein / location=Cvel_scaffold2225:7476-7787(-) / protein_length=104 / sequence_SO=supercontig / SO=protein_coding / is_pseudo=false